MDGNGYGQRQVTRASRRYKWSERVARVLYPGILMSDANELRLRQSSRSAPRTRA